MKLQRSRFGGKVVSESRSEPGNAIIFKILPFLYLYALARARTHVLYYPLRAYVLAPFSSSYRFSPFFSLVLLLLSICSIHGVSVCLYL
jgi:hypothetical protein